MRHPAPWKECAHQATGAESRKKTLLDPDFSNLGVVDVADANGEMVIEWVNHDQVEYSSPEVKRLIYAAPELLAALEGLSLFCESLEQASWPELKPPLPLQSALEIIARLKCGKP
jgi:hypothetical protein